MALVPHSNHTTVFVPLATTAPQSVAVVTVTGPVRNVAANGARGAVDITVNVALELVTLPAKFVTYTV
jgi:hypothetical protein